MQDEILQKVVEFIAANNDIQAEQITIDATFEDLNMDSLDGLALVSDLENHYNITIPNEEAMKIRSVRQTVESLGQLLVLQQQ